MSRKENLTGGLKLGILGGGQLGKMLVNAASQWDLNVHVLDPSAECPAAVISPNFTRGGFRDYDTVYSFGKKMDILTIEIEDVNSDALAQLEKEGKTVHPAPDKLKIIQDKGLQKQFYEKHGFPTSSYVLLNGKDAIVSSINEGRLKFPFVQKLRTSGYDGRGVALIRNNGDVTKVLDGESVVEDLVSIKKEISVIVARNADGGTVVYDPVEMVFHAEQNLIEYQLCPAELSPEIAGKAAELALELIRVFDISGLLAVEMFLDEKDRLYINEVAPRPHNSGHHTIEGAYTSQYEQHLRAIHNLPLGSTKPLSPTVMVNLLGEPGYQGLSRYSGLKECLAMEGVKIHLYGKKETRPYRKMGHVTVLDDQLQEAKKKAEKVLNTLKIIA